MCLYRAPLDLLAHRVQPETLDPKVHLALLVPQASLAKMATLALPALPELMDRLVLRAKRYCL